MEYLANDWLEKNGSELIEHKGREWKCIEVKKKSEINISESLFMKNIPFFCPLYFGVNEKRIYPLFPGYLFVCLKQNEVFEILIDSRIKRYLPISNQKREIEYLQSIEKIQQFSDFSSLSNFSIGNSVTIDQGALKGLEGKIASYNESTNKITVNIHALNKEITVDIPIRMVKRAKESEAKVEINRQISASLKKINRELFDFLKKNPNYLYKIAPDSFEILIADILDSLGYEIEFTPRTRDGGRDLLAIFNSPLGKLLTIVECKRYAPDRKIGINYVERLLWTMTRNDNANCSLLATTSYFSEEARKLERQYNWLLKLKDFSDIKDWVNNYGITKSNSNSGLWLPSASMKPGNLIINANN
jgi:restriction system protein